MPNSTIVKQIAAKEVRIATLEKTLRTAPDQDQYDVILSQIDTLQEEIKELRLRIRGDSAATT